MSHSGSGDFIVVLKDAADDSIVTTLSDVNGDWFVVESEFLAAGEYYLSIEAGGAWTVDILGF